MDTTELCKEIYKKVAQSETPPPGVRITEYGWTLHEQAPKKLKREDFKRTRGEKIIKALPSGTTFLQTALGEETDTRLYQKPYRLISITARDIGNEPNVPIAVVSDELGETWRRLTEFNDYIISPLPNDND